MIKSKLIYLGARFDDSFLFSDVLYHNYDKYYLYEKLPDTLYYSEHELGYHRINTEPKLLKTLKSCFGHYTRHKNRLYFPDYNLVYYLNTDYKNIHTLKNADLLIKGYVPSLHIQNQFHKRNIYYNCDISKHVHDNAVCIHLKEYIYDDKCYCAFVDSF